MSITLWKRKKMSFISSISDASVQYLEIKQALQLFPYFEAWEDNVIDECCRLSSIKEYPEDSIILGSCSADAYMTFFILEGVCKIIHHLQVRVKVNSYGKTIYKLYRPKESNPSNSESAKIEYSSMLFTEMHKFERKKSDVAEETPEDVEEKEGFSKEENESSNDEKPTKRDEEKEENGNDSELDDKEKDDGTSNSNIPGESQQDSKIIAGEDEEKETDEMEKGNDDEDGDTNKTEEELKVKSGPAHVIPEERRQDSLKKEEQPKPMSDGVNSLKEIKELKEEVTATPQPPPSQEESKITYDEDHHLKILEECKKKAKQHMRSVGHNWTTDKPKDVKSFFVQVGLFYKGSCFGLEEHLRDTVVMSASKVKCLRIPRRFLFQHNPCNVWNRIRLFFSLHLPTEEQILEQFSSNRAWVRKKQKMSERISSLKKIPNYTLCSDIPYAIRLLQEL